MGFEAYTLHIYSNDGSTELGSVMAGTTTGVGDFTVLENGVTDGTNTYTYSGNKQFIGLTSTPNSTNVEYEIGQTYNISTATTLYIVEQEPAADVPRIIYNNTVIAELSDKEITITCAGKKMLSDIVIVNPAVEEEVSLISFTIDSTSYQAEEGMTWADWIDSEYSDGTYAPHPNMVTQPCKYPNSYFITEDGTSGGSVLMTDTIIANHAYSTVYIDTSGGAA